VSAAASDAAGGAIGQPFELAAGVLAVFTSRRGGISAPPYDTLNLSGAVGDEAAAVNRNRQLLARACGLGDGRMVWMRQVHGSAVGYTAGPSAEAADPAASLVSAAGGGRGAEPAEIDAIFTDVPGLALGVLVADCAPVLVADPEARVVAAAHAGREGMAAGVVPRLVTAMSEAGADPARMHAVIGPLICGACYEVPPPLAARVTAAVPESSAVTRAGTPGIDVRSGLRAQLARAGVGTVSSDPRCTAEDPGLYSYRRDGRTGRLAGLVWLE
jgi:polyphenol oxidase